MNRINIPQMELNGAVLSKRLRQTITQESRFQFEDVHQLIDSQTVLCQLHKLSTRFKVFEGVRIGEVQAATGGNMSCWGWIDGKKNVADLTTRPQEPLALGVGSIWMDGPPFLYLPEEEWGVLRNPLINEAESLPGEKSVSGKFFATHMHGAPGAAAEPFDDMSIPDYDFYLQTYVRCAHLHTCVSAVARCLAAVLTHSFAGGRSSCITPEVRQKALRLMVQHAQRTAWVSARDVRSHFKIVAPVFQDSVWVVGTRISACNPLSPENKPQILLPPKAPLTLKLMTECHINACHGGRDATLSIFRARWYTSHATRLAQTVCGSCTLCKKLKAKRIEQMMGQMPPERLMPSPPFDSLVLDLFGPYLIRGEVQKRSSSKVWGIIFIDLVSRAAHIEVTCGYDTKSFLLGLRRFSAIRGWPSTIFSDPGTQLVGASNEIKAAWDAIESDALQLACTQNGTRWVFGPADSPWYQGAAEALIKSAKRSITAAVGKSRLSMSEILTVFTEVANLLNERPIGIRPSPEHEVSILTPNMLLLGRSTRVNPGGYESPVSIYSRVTMVQDVVTAFWKHWTSQYAPTLLLQSKWMHASRPLQVGDVVLVADSNVLRGEYRVARVSAVHPSDDGILRRVSVSYKLYKTHTSDHKLSGGRDVTVERSVQRLSLLLPYTET